MCKSCPPRVLIVSTKVDVSTDLVLAKLVKRGADCVRINTEEFPFDAELTSEFRDGVPVPDVHYSVRGAGSWQGPPTSIWYRRVRSPSRPDCMEAGVYDFCLREARATLLGAVLAQPCRIMSCPDAVWAAEQKTYQLRLAQQIGLKIPGTIISNDPQRIRAAYDRFNQRMVVKPARTGYVDLGSEQLSIYTSQVLAEHLDHLREASLSPAIYQELIEKRSDVRVTYVAGRLFVAEIDSQSDDAAKLDWRRTQNPDLPHRSADLPQGVSENLRRLMVALRLEYGAIDLIRTPHDEYVFLEVNPNGQWQWLDDMLEMGITDSIVDWLLGRRDQAATA